MSAHRPEHLEQAAAWVLGSLDEVDRPSFEAHLASACSVCDAEIAGLREGARALAASSPPAVPPPALRARVLARVREEMAAAGMPAAEPRVVRLPPRRPAPWLAWSMAAAAAALAVSTVLLWQANERTGRALASAERERADLERQLAEERAWMALLGSPDARAVDFAPTPDGAPAPRARATWDPASRRAVLVFEHLTAPAGRDYQLWGLHPSGPASLGLVRADASGRAVLRLDDVGDPATLQAFAVSLEQAGGSPNPNAPAGPVVMVGRVGG